MSSAFGKKTALPKAERMRKYSFSRRGLPFHAAIMAGLATFALVLLSGRFFIALDRQGQAEAAAPLLRELAADLARPLGRSLDGGDQSTANLEVRRTLREIPDGSLFVTDETGRMLLDTQTGIPEPELKNVESLGNGVFLGWVGEGRFVELRYPLRGKLLPLGTLHIRSALHVPYWAGQVHRVGLWASLTAAILTFFYMSHALRGVAALHRVLDRAAHGDFYQRAPEVGCHEVKGLISRTHEALTAVGQASEKVQRVYVETAIALSKTIEAKDRYTSGHSQRVSIFSVEIAEQLGFDEERLETMRLGALLHDIGKVAVPDSVLLKPGLLDDDEFETMKKHPMAADRILSAIPGLRDMADIARSHHEKWDGSGYPFGVAGDAIPIEGRIVAIADAYDALTTKRSYKSAMEPERALEIIEKDAGTHFDPELAKLFVDMKRNGVGYKPLKKSGPTEVVIESSR